MILESTISYITKYIYKIQQEQEQATMSLFDKLPLDIT